MSQIFFRAIVFGCAREQFVDWQPQPVWAAERANESRLDQSSDWSGNDTVLTAGREISLLHMTTDAWAAAAGSQIVSTAGYPPNKKKKQLYFVGRHLFPCLNLMGRCDKVADRKWRLTEIKIEQKVSSWCHEGVDCKASVIYRTPLWQSGCLKILVFWPVK